MDTEIRLSIGGMTCINCQNRIEKTLRGMHGVLRADVRYDTGTAELIYDAQQVTLDDIIAAIEDLDYEVLTEKTTGGQELINQACLLIVIICLYVMLQSTGVLNLLAPSQLADTGMGYGMLVIIGLLTSVHCLAMCGGINLSQCITQMAQKDSEQTGKLAAFLPALAYNMGRVLSYTTIGFIFGLAGMLTGVGQETGISVLLQGAFKIVAGVFMVIMGINMLGLFPWLRRFSIRLPKFLAQKAGNQRAKATRPFVVGLLNGLMPCGPLQSMWIVALATGNPLSGAISMFLFSLGTVPLMLGFGSAVIALGRKFADQVMKVGAVLVVVLGLAMLSQGGTLSGMLSPELLLVLLIALSIAGMMLSIPIQSKMIRYAVRAISVLLVLGAYMGWSYADTQLQSSTSVNIRAQISDGVQVVHSTLEPGSYPDLTVQAGVPVRWTIVAPEGSINGCNGRMLIADYGIEHTFHLGENVIEFMPEESGTVHYSCWMGMIRGNIVVVGSTAENNP